MCVSTGCKKKVKRKTCRTIQSDSCSVRRTTHFDVCISQVTSNRMNTGTGRMDDDARKQFVKKKHTWKKKEEKERPDDMATGSSPKSSCRKPEISCDRATRLQLGWVGGLVLRRRTKKSKSLERRCDMTPGYSSSASAQIDRKKRTFFFWLRVSHVQRKKIVFSLFSTSWWIT